MQLEQLGEFALIDLIKQDTINKPDSVIVGIGDDAAVLNSTPGQLQLVTTDMLVEKVHFDLGTSTAWQLGYKAIGVNLSDIAAMGGIPRNIVVSIALPKELPVDFVVNLYDGMKEICREFDVNIVGGDTVSSPHGLIINVTVIGEVDPKQLQRRSGAREGELVVITGTLGDSGCGLDLLIKGNWEGYESAALLVERHLMPKPQVHIGPLLAAFGSTSMNDISDGLASEVNEIALASHVGMRIYREKIPLSSELRTAAALLEKSPVEYALYGGEDYQLLFTIPPEQFNQLVEADIGVPLTVIGEVINQSQGTLLVDQDDQTSKLEAKGYNHFR
ncbi:thiamine-phosphate kinase [Pelosinus sp. sgz500959]|uniref:thiamine-phosphate kinase n=1 Tax=Pelosinus sp. sgz500959 TaxID=3242472 RepID=UPI00367008FD